jgi:hypothetical protein
LILIGYSVNVAKKREEVDIEMLNKFCIFYAMIHLYSADVALWASLHHRQLVPSCDAAKTERRKYVELSYAAGHLNVFVLLRSKNS